MNTLAQYLSAAGWTPYGAGYVDPTGERYADLSGDYGFAFELNWFEDADDADGVARVMWVSMDLAGDTLAELAAALDLVGRGAGRLAIAA